MNQPNKKNRFNSASLRGSRSAHTVLLRMARDEARAARIRELYEARKEEDPRFTWRAVAEYVGVSERAAHAWGTTGGINPEHLPKIAEVFKADPDWIWRGPRDETPDPFLAGPAGQFDGTQLDRIAAAVEEARRERMLQGDELRALIAQQQEIIETLRGLVDQLKRPAADRLPPEALEIAARLVEEMRKASTTQAARGR
jgi:hypothetical protein